MKLFVEIKSESDLNETWKDALVPNMSFNFNETEIDDCVIQDNRIYASYNPLEVHKDEIKVYHDVSLGEVRYELKKGIYGLHRAHHGKDLNELIEIELSKNV